MGFVKKLDFIIFALCLDIGAGTWYNLTNVISGGNFYMKSFLMMGQSNMAGRGLVSSVPPIRNPKCSMLRNGRWQPMREPINVDRPVFFNNPAMDICSGVGPAASFADSYANYYDEQVGMIPCAEGGSSLDEWKVDGQLFLHAFYQAKLAMNISELSGIIWHQGEAECSIEERATTYKERFLVIMNEFQARLGVKLPIVVGEMGEFLARREKPMPYLDEVNRQLHMLADENDNIAIASAKGLEDRGDVLHFSAAAAREFGCRYFEAYKTLREGK